MDLAHLLDHTLLKPFCTLAEIKEVCNQALKHQFAAVCIPPYYVKEASKLLEGNQVKVVTVIGFPMGFSTVAAKVEEIKRAADEGADELDVVINLCAVKSGNWNYVKSEIDTLTTACHMKGKIFKTIIETGALDGEELQKIGEICTAAQVDFVNTSTGYLTPGASVEVVSQLRQALPNHIRIKASGDINDQHFAEQLVQAGANRLGSSSGLQLFNP